MIAVIASIDDNDFDVAIGPQLRVNYTFVE